MPATNQLMKKDIVYRIEKAHIKAVVCTAEGDIAQAVDDAGAGMRRGGRKTYRERRQGRLAFL